jgi:hypothetical protein
VTSISITTTGVADSPWFLVTGCPLSKGATLKIYPGAPHGLCTTLRHQVNEELLAFFNA